MKSKTDYTQIDAAIVAAIRTCGCNPLYHPRVSRIAEQIANETGREGFRVTDGRLQALRKAGVIAHDRKAGRWVEVAK